MVDSNKNQISLVEQGIRDLKQNLSQALTGLADVKQLADRRRREAEKARLLAEDFERQAISHLKKMQDGLMDRSEADRLAQEALYQKEHNETEYRMLTEQTRDLDITAGRLKDNVDDIKNTISDLENELLTLRSRERAAQAAQRVGEAAASYDSAGTLARLDSLKNKIAEDEAMAEAFLEMTPNQQLDSEIERALGEDPDAKADRELKKLKDKMGLS